MSHNSDLCEASGVVLGTAIASDICGVTSLTHNAPSSLTLRRDPNGVIVVRYDTQPNSYYALERSNLREPWETIAMGAVHVNSFMPGSGKRPEKN